jgi:hypothetical protein
MSRELIAVILVVLIGIPVIYFGATTLFMSSSQGDVADTADSANIASCEQIKQSQCTTGSISESDYPDSCFQNGEHVLEDPYRCSN